ncbi:hypothetical protein ACLKA7_000918, partial [Drosophila subpalustris]
MVLRKMLIVADHEIWHQQPVYLTNQ